jgi:GT2 family glycosyltransferase
VNAADLTVAVATLDRPAGLARSLDALLAGHVPPAEILVVDQSRDDVNAAVIAERQGRGVPIVHVRQERRGLSASRNAAWARASRPILAVSDDDCVADAGWVAAIARAMAGPAAPAAVAGPVLPLGPETPGTYAVSSRTSAVPATYRDPVAPWVVGTGGNFALRRAWAARVGGYDERLGAGSPGGAGEDLDLIHRLLRAGAAIAYEPAAVVYHERQGQARRLATRSSYGRGVGACCGVWLRAGDRSALRVLAQWAALRGHRLAGAALRRGWETVREEALVLRGTASGLIYGLRAPGAGPRPDMETHHDDEMAPHLARRG